MTRRDVFLAVATSAEALPLLGLHPIVTGMGARRYELQGRRAVVSAGFAGACQPDLRPGDVVTGTLRTLDHIATPAEKRRLQSEGVEAVDMESHYLAEAASAAGLPFRSVRVIIDTLPDRALSLATAANYPRAAASLRAATLTA